MSDEKDSRKIKARYYNLRKCTLKQYLDKRSRLENVLAPDDFLKRATFRDRVLDQFEYQEKRELKVEHEAERKKQRQDWLKEFAEEIMHHYLCK
ncbi:hypothetical protein JTE90_022650 [Oedothorax gibbosus]|uniref:Uncharacterized protein n=1 Tax=Oedothorax gibbosus TaxID=931172 RepID=A0AAV6TT39_9ARAC|nr:hypothetical protein JTE90_022650 [Oedothorax gibbosus]